MMFLLFCSTPPTPLTNSSPAGTEMQESQTNDGWHSMQHLSDLAGLVTDPNVDNLANRDDFTRKTIEGIKGAIEASKYKSELETEFSRTFKIDRAVSADSAMDSLFNLSLFDKHIWTLNLNILQDICDYLIYKKFSNEPMKRLEARDKEWHKLKENPIAKDLIALEWWKMVGNYFVCITITAGLLTLMFDSFVKSGQMLTNVTQIVTTGNPAKVYPAIEWAASGVFVFFTVMFGINGENARLKRKKHYDDYKKKTDNELSRDALAESTLSILKS
ncbi:MAG: hypothetical protein H6850_01840 [Alphaproteobacteria bacterium]|nr:MAG: hypothetical protein H6850_01840 [Alphaproteobacteria bacterium]